jgi:hypothetical protein
MNDRSGRSASSAKSKKMRTSATLLLAMGLALMFSESTTMAIGGEVPAGTIVLVVRETAPRPPGSDSPTASKPIPGVDIIVRKKPGPPPPDIVVPVDASGKFSVRLKGPGNYTVSTACSSGDCPAIALSLNVAGKALKPEADGNASYEFTVGQDGLDLGGQIFVRGAQPIIVNGKSVTPQGIWDDTDIVHVLPGTVKLQQQPPNPLASKVGENGSPPPVERNRLSNPASGGDIKPGISDQAAAGGLTSYSTAPRPDGPVDNKPLGRIDLLIQIAQEGGAPIGTGMWVSTTTADTNGAFKFDKLPPGKYKLTIADQPPQSVTVGAEGTLGGNLMHGSDGGTTITYTGLEKPLEKPVGGFGNGMGGVPGMGPGMGPGGGMAPPGAAPGMGPMGPGAMGPGGGMRP